MSPARTPHPAHSVGANGPGAEEAYEYLSLAPRQLPPRWLYDALGSSLFDAICLLPWYRITRAEMQLLADHADEIVRMAAPDCLVELGCGNGQKLVTLLRSASSLLPPVYLIDVSAAALARSRKALQEICAPAVTAIQAPYEDGLAQLPRGPKGGRQLTLFLGSNIGNFDPEEATAFVQSIRGVQSPGDWLLIGVDLVKPERDLLLVYDDPLGLTAAFNRNVLLRLNNEAGADFDLAGFQHRAVWNERESRVEMHLVSLKRQDVVLPGRGEPLRVRFDQGDSIWTESSYKYEERSFIQRIEEGGFSHRMRWIHADARFLLALFQAK